MTTPDVAISPEGTIVLFYLLTPNAEDWVEQNVIAERQFFGGSLVCEDRFAGNLVAGMSETGLVVRVFRNGVA
jgi:hypothetical protein